MECFNAHQMSLFALIHNLYHIKINIYGLIPLKKEKWVKIIAIATRFMKIIHFASSDDVSLLVTHLHEISKQLHRY